MEILLKSKTIKNEKYILLAILNNSVIYAKLGILSSPDIIK